MPKKRGTCRRFDAYYAKEGEPWFTGPSKYPLKLGAFWLVQSLWSFVVLLPVTVAQAFRPRAEMGAWGWIGFALFMGFFVYESVGAPSRSFCGAALRRRGAGVPAAR